MFTAVVIAWVASTLFFIHLTGVWLAAGAVIGSLIGGKTINIADQLRSSYRYGVVFAFICQTLIASIAIWIGANLGN